ncbi:response regulator transcription factor [Chloroflexi bacterium TSY]|nr:response regulator transcription factor [Chloroflexi bacterium TSY]
MNATILIIEDEAKIAHWLQKYLEREGFATEVAYDGSSGLTQARTLLPDLIVLDLMLPGLDGMEICERLRIESDVPIIMLTAKGAQPDRNNGLEVGADDYIVKPFDPKEVVLRVKAVLRRVQNKVQQSLTRGGITLDEATQQVTIGNERVNLSVAQFALLATFMRHPHQILTREQLIAHAFDGDYDGYDRSIDAHIRRLRKQVIINGYQPIQTVYGAGYKFVPEGQ